MNFILTKKFVNLEKLTLKILQLTLILMMSGHFGINFLNHSNFIKKALQVEPPECPKLVC